MANQTQTRRIIIKVDTNDSQKLREIADKFGLLNRNTKSLSDNMKTLTNAFRGYLGFLGVREIVRMSDEMQNLSNRLKIVSKSGEDTTKTMGDLLKLADETKQSVGGIAEVYVRLAGALKQVNPSSESLLVLTKTLINTFRLVGSTTTETVNTLIQLSQAFSSGQLRGQELRSVMEQNAELARLLRERFGQNIYKKAEEGAISAAEVMKVLYENQKRVNETAKELTPTFEQTLTKAINKVQFAIFTLNKDLTLSGKFATGVNFIFERFGIILASIGTVAGALALTQLPALIASIKELSIAALAFGKTNVLGIALTATAILVVAFNKDLTQFVDRLRNVGAWFYYINAEAQKMYVNFNLLLAKPLNKLGLLNDNDLANLGAQLDKVKSLYAKAEQLGTPTARPETAAAAGDPDKAFRDLIKKMEALSGPGKVRKLKEILGDLNKEFLNTRNIDVYNRKLIDFNLYKLNRQFEEGKFDIFEYNERLRDLRIGKIQRDLNNGIISFTEFNKQVSKTKIVELTARFDAGKISLIEYNTELVKISNQFLPGGALISGTAAYLDSIGTLSDNISRGIQQTFSQLEDSFVSFISTGKFNFADFTKAILDDLTRIIVRATIIAPIAKGLLDFNTPTKPGADISAGQSYTDYTNRAAKGMAFENNVRKFASGGVVNKPTAFSYNGGRPGLMGEAGTEAILPLARGRGGRLGVEASTSPVIINVYNNGNTDVSTSESTGPNGERTIDIIISAKVKQAIADGSMDKTFNQSYGLKRKGS